MSTAVANGEPRLYEVKSLVLIILTEFIVDLKDFSTTLEMTTAYDRSYC